MKLHNPKRQDGSTHMYCGPAALCAISGDSYERVRKIVNTRIRFRKENQGITSMAMSEVKDALYHLGFNCTWNPANVKGMTLNQYLKSRREHEKNVTLVINLTDHFVVVQGDKLVDNHTTIPVHIAIAPWKRKRVESVWFVTEAVDAADLLRRAARSN